MVKDMYFKVITTLKYSSLTIGNVYEIKRQCVILTGTIEIYNIPESKQIYLKVMLKT